MSLILDFDLFLRDHRANVKLSAQAECMGYRLAGIIGSKTDCWISQEALAEMYGKTIRTIISSLKQLEAAGIILINSDRKDKRKNRYKFSPWLRNYYQHRHVSKKYLSNFKSDIQGHLRKENDPLPPEVPLIESAQNEEYMKNSSRSTCKNLHVLLCANESGEPVLQGVSEVAQAPKETTKQTRTKDIVHLRKISVDKSESAQGIPFDNFWTIYPKKKDKVRAKKNWLKIDLITQQVILEKLAKQIRDDAQWQNLQFIPHPSTYLNARRWEDEVEVLQPIVQPGRNLSHRNEPRSTVPIWGKGHPSYDSLYGDKKDQ